MLQAKPGTGLQEILVLNVKPICTIMISIQIVKPVEQKKLTLKIGNQSMILRPIPSGISISWMKAKTKQDPQLSFYESVESGYSHLWLEKITTETAVLKEIAYRMTLSLQHMQKILNIHHGQNSKPAYSYLSHSLQFLKPIRLCQPTSNQWGRNLQIHLKV